MTTQITKGLLLGGKLISFYPVNLDGTPLINIPDSLYTDDIYEIIMSTQIETGDKIVDKADGVGVINVHEEDDTLIGVDLEVTLGSVNMWLLYNTLGGTISYGDEGVVTGYTFPSIMEQRDSPKRFRVDVYVPSYTGGNLDGYLIHRFSYCKCSVNGYSVAVGDIAKPVIIIKARQNPTDEQIQSYEFTTVLPN